MDMQVHERLRQLELRNVPSKDMELGNVDTWGCDLWKAG